MKESRDDVGTEDVSFLVFEEVRKGCWEEGWEECEEEGVGREG